MKAVEWLLEHPYVIAFVGSAILNTALRFKTAEQWVSFCERWPAAATLIRISRAVGVDPVKAINALRDFLQSSSTQPECKQTGETCVKGKSQSSATDDVSGPANYKNPREE